MLPAVRSVMPAHPDLLVPAGTIMVRVVRKTAETPDISLFVLAADDGASLPGYAAGAHVDVHLPNGLVRQYSLCNDGDGHCAYEIAVLRDPQTRGGSRAMHDAVHAGDVIHISAPKNHFPLAGGTHRSLLLAGGIGVTPILCMAERLANSGSDFEMHYSTRSQARTAFLLRITQSKFAARVTLHFDDGPPQQILEMLSLIAAQPPGTHLYVCGPRGFIGAAVGAAKQADWPDSRVHVEYFSAVVEAPDTDGSFEIHVASTGQVFTVPPGTSVIEVLANAGIEVPTSCEQGVCGTCVTRILEGEPDHRDHYLTESERAANDQFTPCCSRAKGSRLVLDL